MTSTNNGTTSGTTSQTTTGTTSGFIIPFSSPLTSTRSQEGLIAQWNFDNLEDKVGDLDLKIIGNGVNLLPEHRLQLNGGYVENSETDKLSTALQSANAFTLELWLQPKFVLQDEAMLITLIEENGRNFSLSQEKDTMLVKLRTDDASVHYDRLRGGEALKITDAFRDQLLHVVWTYDGNNTEIWIDGIKRGTMPLPAIDARLRTNVGGVGGFGRQNGISSLTSKNKLNLTLQHVVWTFDGNNSELWIDGVRDSSQTLTRRIGKLGSHL